MTRKMLAALAGGLLLFAADASAQAWPTKPIKLIAPYPPGGQTDVVSRYFAEKLSGVLGQQVIVENKAGAQGMVGAELAKNAAPDGYTFVYVNSSMMCINPYVYKKLPYDGFKDFVPVTQHGLAPLVMVTPPSLGLKSVKDFVAWARDRKGKVNYASFGNGSSSHIWGEMLNQAEKLDMTHVPYKGAGPAIQDTLAGHIPMTIQDLAASGPSISGGKLDAACRHLDGALAAPARRADLRGGRLQDQPGGLERDHGAGRHAQGDHRAHERGDPQAGADARRQGQASGHGPVRHRHDTGRDDRDHEDRLRRLGRGGEARRRRAGVTLPDRWPSSRLMNHARPAGSRRSGRS